MNYMKNKEDLHLFQCLSDYQRTTYYINLIDFMVALSSLSVNVTLKGFIH